MTFPEVLSVIAGGIGLLVGVIAFIRAQAADGKAERAQALSEEALARAAVATEEAAGAMRRASESTQLARSADHKAERAEDSSAEALARSAAVAEEAASASREAAAAAQDAAAAMHETATANREAAAAVQAASAVSERLERIATTQPGSQETRLEVRWECEQVKGATWVARNTGTGVAHTALLSDATRPPKYIRPDEVIPRDVSPGDHLQFRASADGVIRSPRVRIAWLEDGDVSPRVQEVTLILR